MVAGIEIIAGGVLTRNRRPDRHEVRACHDERVAERTGPLGDLDDESLPDLFVVHAADRMNVSRHTAGDTADVQGRHRVGGLVLLVRDHERTVDVDIEPTGHLARDVRVQPLERDHRQREEDGQSNAQPFVELDLSGALCCVQRSCSNGSCIR